MTVREPRTITRLPSPSDPTRSAPERDDFVKSSQPHIKEVWDALSNIATFRYLLLGFSVASFFSFGIMQWQPAFFIRSYGLSTGELGTWFTIVTGISGVVGTYLGGELACRRAANNERLQLKGIALLYCSLGFVAAFIYLSPSYYLAFALMGLCTVGGTLTTGPLFATIQTLVPDKMRAVAIAIIYLFANLIGLGLGPLAAGMLSDALRPLVGEESLRYSLLALCPGYFWAGWHLWQASMTVTSDLQIAANAASVLHEAPRISTARLR